MERVKKPIKALSIRQPWAQLIVDGHKKIENRTWRTNFRGPFLIHAAKKFDHQSVVAINSILWDIDSNCYEDGIYRTGISADKKHYKRGGFIGVGIVIGCVEESDRPFFTGPYGFELAGVFPIDFIPYRGSLKFFDVPESVKNKINIID